MRVVLVAFQPRGMIDKRAVAAQCAWSDVDLLVTEDAGARPAWVSSLGVEVIDAEVGG